MSIKLKLLSFVFGFIGSLALSVFMPVSALAQGGQYSGTCNPNFALYHPTKAKDGTKNLTLAVGPKENPRSPEVLVPFHAVIKFEENQSRGCASDQARIVFSWGKKADTFRLSIGPAQSRDVQLSATAIGDGKHTVKFQISDASGKFKSVSKEVVANLTISGVGKGTGGDDSGGSGDDKVEGEAGGEVDSTVQVTGTDLDAVLGTFSNPLEFETIPELIVRLIDIGLLLAAMIAVVAIIWGGFMMVTAAGSETRLTQGKKTVIWAIGGLIVCLMSFSIVAIIERVITR